MKSVALLMLVVGLMVTQRAYGAVGAVRVVTKKYFSGHIVVGPKATMTLYVNPLDSGKNLYKAPLTIADDAIHIGKHRALSLQSYDIALGNDMEAAARFAIPFGQVKTFYIPISGINGVSAQITVRSNADTSSTTFLGSYSGKDLVRLGDDTPKKALLLSKRGNILRVAFLMVACGNGDCDSGVVVVRGPLQKYLRTSK